MQLLWYEKNGLKSTLTSITYAIILCLKSLKPGFQKVKVRSSNYVNKVDPHKTSHITKKV